MSNMHIAIAAELDTTEEVVKGVASELKLRKGDDIREAVIAHLSRNDDGIDEPVSAGNPDEGTPSTTATKKERKPGLTLSQRRALLRLLTDGEASPATGFKALPYQHLVEVGYAVVAESDDTPGTFTLTPSGQARAESINPGYLVWSAGETVVLTADGEPAVKGEDGTPIRPAAGTKRAAEAAAPAEPVEA